MARRILNGVSKLIHLFRYRFLLFAGLLPYCLGAAIVGYDSQPVDFTLFITGLVGLFFVLVGVEAFNEYFDWHLGTDRVFQLNPKPITNKKFYIGVASFGVALIFALYLTVNVGWGIFIFALVGFIAAAQYLGPPIRFTYRGLGEVVIALSYGPFMVLGSYYLQTGTVSAYPLIFSSIPAVLLFIIAIMNEVPDFLQDRLVGKRNLCVRLGSAKIVLLYACLLFLFFSICVLGLLLNIFPTAVWLVLLLAPFAYRNYKIAKNNHQIPMSFLPAIRGTIIFYLITNIIFISALCGGNGK